MPAYPTRLLACSALLLLLVLINLGVASPARAATRLPSVEDVTPSWTAPTLSTAPSVALGESLHLVGSNYPPGSRVQLVLIGGTVEYTYRFVLPSALPDAAGRLDANVAVPSGAVAGRALLYATSTDARSRGHSAMVRLTIVPAVPLLVRYWWAVTLGALVVVLLLGGVVLLAVRRRRRSRRSVRPTPTAGTAGAA